jgi:predicted PurR-regulated permease PerM
MKERMRDNSDAWSSRQTLLTLTLAVVTVLLLYVSWLFAWPFYPALTWALALAAVLPPVYERLPYANRYPNTAAAVTVLLIGLFVIGPLLWLGFYLAKQTRDAVQMLQELITSPQWRTVLERYPSVAGLFDRLKDQVDGQSQLQGAIETVGRTLPAVLGGSLWVAGQILIMLFVLFYFLRDRRAIVRWLKKVVPLTEDETERVFGRAQDCLEATVMGTLLIALLKGLQWGPIMWLLGAPVPMLWGALMAVSSLIPWLGAPIVGLISAFFLVAQGSPGKAIIAVVWGVIVIGLIDTLLYPLLVGRKLTLYPIAMFFAFVGGVLLFGMSGLVLGPLLLTLTWTALEIWRERTERGHAATEAIRKEAG